MKNVYNPEFDTFENKKCSQVSLMIFMYVDRGDVFVHE